MSKLDHSIIMQYLKSGESRTLFNRYDIEDFLTEMKHVQVVEDHELPNDIIKLNSVVKIKDEADNKVIELMLVTPKQADIKTRRISVMSPIGIALIGYRQGQRVKWKVPLGERSFYIMEVKKGS